MHGPSALLDIGSHRFDVALCGHTHGVLSRHYSAGRFDLDPDRVLLVSRGVGYGWLPVRINAPAAVMLCTITSASSGPSSQ